MDSFGIILYLLIAAFVFMCAVYFTRWVFGIDQIIELQKEQTKLIRKLTEDKDKNENEFDDQD
jgi:hypothetical protein